MNTNKDFFEGINKINQAFDDLSRRHSATSERNQTYFKILATVKNDLERAVKSPEKLLDTVFKSIDTIREITPYYSADQGVNKIDPPLTDQEKETFRQKFNEKFAK